QLWPVPKTGLTAEVALRTTKGDAALQNGRHPDGLVHARQAHLDVRRNPTDLLRAQLFGIVRSAVDGSQVVGVVAAHQNDRHRNTDYRAIEQAIVGVEGSLKRIPNQGIDTDTVVVRSVEVHALFARNLFALLTHTVGGDVWIAGAQDVASPVQHHAEADIVGTDDVRAVDREKAFGVDSWAKQVSVHPGVLVVNSREVLHVRSD